MWNFFYKNKRALILTLCLICVWGWLALSQLPRMEDPIIGERGALVISGLSGTPAEQIEALVTEPIEEELVKIPEIKTMVSTSRLGSSTLILELDDNVANLESVWSDVRDHLEDLAPSLASGTLPPELQEVDLRAYSLLVGLSWNLEGEPNDVILNRLAQDLQAQLRNVYGTEDADIFAAPNEEISVDVDPSKLSSLGISLKDLSSTLAKRDVLQTRGQLKTDRNTLQVDLNTPLNSLSQIRQTPLKSGANGEQISIGDVAVISKGIQDPSQRAYINGKPGVVIAARIAPDIRIDQWIISANQALNDFRELLPEGVTLETISDQSQYVKPRIDGLLTSLILGAICVFLTTLLMLGWRTALSVSITMPLTAFMVFGGMHLLNISFDQISVTGLVIALGMLVDVAIVMGDELLTLFKAGLDPAQAIPSAIKTLLIPSLASTLTTVISFIPIVILPGGVGEFVRAIGITIILAMLSSQILSLTVVPALMGHLYPRHSRSGKPARYPSGVVSLSLTRFYTRILDTSYAKPGLSIALCLIVPIAGFLLTTTLSEQFFPATERNQFHIELELPNSAAFQTTEAMTLKVQDTLMQNSEVEQVSWFIGQYAPAFYYNLPRGGKAIPNFAHGIVKTRSAEHNLQLINSLQKELDQTYPEAQILVRALEQGPYIPAPLEIHLSGADVDQLRGIGERIRGALNQINGVTHTRATFGEISPQVALNIDAELAQLAGLDNAAISQQLSANLEGVIGGTILEGTEEIPIRIRLARNDRNDIGDLQKLEFLSPFNASTGVNTNVPLSALSYLELRPEDATITRRNGVRVNTVQGFLSTDILPSQAQDKLKQWVNQHLELPPGYAIQFGGEVEKRDGSVNNLLAKLIPLMVIMLAILVLSFRSFRGAIIIVLVAILSIGLGFFSLAMFNYPLGFMAILGLVSMVGMAINDSIVTLSALKDFPPERRGDRLAIRNVIVRNTRHILTTTLTTVAGFTPLFLEGGQFWPPLVVCIAGGVTGATALSIFFVPNLYLLMFRRRALMIPLPTSSSIALRPKNKF